MRALADLLSELRTRRVSPARLESALASWLAADGPGAARPELGRLFASYDSELRRVRSPRTPSGVRCARSTPLRERPALWGRTPVLFYGFDDLTPLQLDAIETLGRVVDAPVTVSLAYEPGRWAFAGRASTFQALAPLVQEHRELPARAEHYATHARTALSHLERSLFEPGAARVGSGAAVRLLEGGGERAELELVASEIARPARAGHFQPRRWRSLRARRELRWSCSRRSSRAPASRSRCSAGAPSPTRRSAGPLPVSCVASARRRSGVAGELADLLAWLRAPGLLERPVACRLARLQNPPRWALRRR